MKEEIVQEKYAMSKRDHDDWFANAVNAVCCWIDAEKPARAIESANETLRLAQGRNMSKPLMSELKALKQQAEEMCA